MKKRLRTIVIDDERLVRNHLTGLLKRYPEIEVIAEADSCRQGIEKVSALHPDVVFLDIQLSGETGFDLLEKVEIDFHLIFVTAYDEYAIRAFDVNACDYLLKPVHPERLDIAIKRIVKSTKPAAKKHRYDYSDCIYVKLNSTASKFIRLDEIAAIRSAGNYTEVITVKKLKFLILKTMKQWEKDLPADYFVRIHHSSIVSIQAVEKMEKTKLSCLVHLKNQAASLEVSRRYLSRLRKYFQ